VCVAVGNNERYIVFKYSLSGLNNPRKKLCTLLKEWLILLLHFNIGLMSLKPFFFKANTQKPQTKLL